MKKQIPYKFIPFPKAIFFAIPHLKGAELPVFGYIIEHQQSWGNPFTKLTVDEFRYGRLTKGGKRLDRGCGVTNRDAISRALAKLIADGWIKMVPLYGNQRGYFINLEKINGIKLVAIVPKAGRSRRAVPSSQKRDDQPSQMRDDDSPESGTIAVPDAGLPYIVDSSTIRFEEIPSCEGRSRPTAGSLPARNDQQEIQQEPDAPAGAGRTLPRGSPTSADTLHPVFSKPQQPAFANRDKIEAHFKNRMTVMSCAVIRDADGKVINWIDLDPASAVLERGLVTFVAGSASGVK